MEAYIAPPDIIAEFPINFAMRLSFRTNQLESTTWKADPKYAKLFIKCNNPSSTILAFFT